MHFDAKYEAFRDIIRRFIDKQPVVHINDGDAKPRSAASSTVRTFGSSTTRDRNSSRRA
jgi:hypothetical protein